MRFLDLRKEWVFQGLFNCDPKVWIELEHPIEKINRFWCCAGILLGHVDPLYRNEALEVSDSLLIGHEGNILVIWSSEHFKNDRQLVVLGNREAICCDSSMSIRREWKARLAGEERLSIHVGWGR